MVLSEPAHPYWYEKRLHVNRAHRAEGRGLGRHADILSFNCMLRSSM